MAHELVLPAQIASRRDVITTLREIERLSDERLQQRISQEQTGSVRHQSNPTRTLSTLLSANNLEFSDEAMQSLKAVLEQLKEHGQQVRIAFASEPSSEVLERIIMWFRQEIHPSLLVQVGVQPRLAGGCVVQTTMHRYDFSLRKHLLDKRSKLGEAIHRVGQ